MPTDNSIYIFVPCGTKSSPTGKLSFFPAGLPVLFSLSLNLFPVLCNDPFHACPVDPAYGDAGSVHQTDFLAPEPGEVTSVDQIISVDSEEAFLHSCKFPFHLCHRNRDPVHFFHGKDKDGVTAFSDVFDIAVQDASFLSLCVKRKISASGSQVADGAVEFFSEFFL